MRRESRGAHYRSDFSADRRSKQRSHLTLRGAMRCATTLKETDMTQMPALPDMILEPLVRAALIEDLGTFGDITTRTVIPWRAPPYRPHPRRARRASSGMQLAAIAFRLIDPALSLYASIARMARQFGPGDTLAEIEGEAASILSAERVALNFCRQALRHRHADRRLCRRNPRHENPHHLHPQDHPGLRLVEKQAVLHGGGFNHRFFAVRRHPDQG